MPLLVGRCGLLEGCFLWIFEVPSECSKMEDDGGFLTSVMEAGEWGHLPAHMLFSNMSRQLLFMQHSVTKFQY